MHYCSYSNGACQTARRFLARPFSNARLDGSQYRSTDRLRKLNRREIVCRIQIVISRLVSHTELSMLRGVGVRKDLIDLPGFQRNLVAFVLQADNKLFFRFHRNLIEVALDLEFFASNAMGFVPVYLREPSHAIRKSDTSNTFSF